MEQGFWGQVRLTLTFVPVAKAHFYLALVFMAFPYFYLYVFSS